MNFKIRVLDRYGNDVTSERDWYIGIDGTLYHETNDVDNPLTEVNCYDNDYSYEIVKGGKMYGKRIWCFSKWKIVLL